MQEDEAFIRRLVARDPQACRQLVQRHHGRLVAVARPLVGQAAEDVVQEAWLQAFRALPKFEGRSTLNTWLTRIVLNAAYSHHRYDRSRLTRSLDAVLEEEMPMLERFDHWGHWNDPLAVWTADTPEDIAPTVDATIRMAFNTFRPTATLIGQRVIGAKTFGKD